MVGRAANGEGSSALECAHAERCNTGSERARFVGYAASLTSFPVCSGHSGIKSRGSRVCPALSRK